MKIGVIIGIVVVVLLILLGVWLWGSGNTPPNGDGVGCNHDSDCSEGASCYDFPDEEKPRCYAGDNPCDECSSGRCGISKSLIPQVTCLDSACTSEQDCRDIGECDEGMECVCFDGGCAVGIINPGERCVLEPSAGPCKALIPKYYFDEESETCEEFNWGGCEGVVPFNSLEACEDSCYTYTT